MSEVRNNGSAVEGNEKERLARIREIVEERIKNGCPECGLPWRDFELKMGWPAAGVSCARHIISTISCGASRRCWNRETNEPADYDSSCPECRRAFFDNNPPTS